MQFGLEFLGQGFAGHHILDGQLRLPFLFDRQGPLAVLTDLHDGRAQGRFGIHAQADGEDLLLAHLRGAVEDHIELFARLESDGQPVGHDHRGDLQLLFGEREGNLHVAARVQHVEGAGGNFLAFKGGFAGQIKLSGLRGVAVVNRVHRIRQLVQRVADGLAERLGGRSFCARRAGEGADQAEHFLILEHRVKSALQVFAHLRHIDIQRGLRVEGDVFKHEFALLRRAGNHRAHHGRDEILDIGIQVFRHLDALGGCGTTEQRAGARNAGQGLLQQLLQGLALNGQDIAGDHGADDRRAALHGGEAGLHRFGPVQAQRDLRAVRQCGHLDAQGGKQFGNRVQAGLLLLRHAEAAQGGFRVFTVHFQRYVHRRRGRGRAAQHHDQGQRQRSQFADHLLHLSSSFFVSHP